MSDVELTRELEYVKIKDLKGRYLLSKTLDGEINVKDRWITSKRGKVNADTIKRTRREYINYNWKALEVSIKTNGIINPLEIIEKSKTNTGKFRVTDGNHRLAIAELLYPSNQEIPCTFYKNVEVSQERKDMVREFHKNENKSHLGPVNLKAL